MNLKAMFPTGTWDRARGRLMVKKGAYFWAAAEMTSSGDIILTDFGRRIALPVPAEATATSAVAYTSIHVVASKSKRRGTAASAKPLPEDVDDLEL